MNSTSSLLDCKVDWLTLTATDERKRDRLFQLGTDLCAAHASEVGTPRRWHWHGYDGQHAGGITYGRRPDSDILQLSGPLADAWLDTAWSHADHCTRVDLAATVKVEGEIDGYLRRHADECEQYRVASRPSLNASLILVNGKAQTFYIGRRISDFFARVYDKHAESGDPAYQGCIRYELEVKSHPAQRAIHWLGSVADRQSAIRDALFQHFTRRGLDPEFSCVGESVSLRGIRAASDTSTRLAWLGSSVRPVVERLLPACGPEELLKVLGFPRNADEMVKLGYLVTRDHHRDPLQEDEEID